MNQEKKKFVLPEAIIIGFADDDIITYSIGGEYPDEWVGNDWEDD